MEPDTLSYIVTGRKESLFDWDIQSRKSKFNERIGGSRILVIGGAGSIGSATVKELAIYRPSALHVVDLSENTMVELVRDLRGSQTPFEVKDFRTLSLDYGSEIFHRFLLEQDEYDYILNFAAVKHVRSEKDIYSLLHMVDTNIVKQDRLLSWLDTKQDFVRYFSVSTDKAANPVNLMGATKRLMEHIMFYTGDNRSNPKCITSARFANVAFSDGSLLVGWFHRLAKRQPIAVPSGTQRYFISLKEAGQICLLASIFGEDGQIFIPKLNPKNDLKELVPIAKKFIEVNDFLPREYRDEAKASANLKLDIEQGYYPLLLTSLDTNGEKPFEEFIGEGENILEIGMNQLAAVNYIPAPKDSVKNFLHLAQNAISNSLISIAKRDIIDAIQMAIPTFCHKDTGKNLDDRL